MEVLFRDLGKYFTKNKAVTETARCELCAVLRGRRNA
nr:MAG TPA: hypothetical protein [Caudoviricetes sp.]